MTAQSDDAISCVVATHGRHELLRESLRSVAQQRRRPLEIIVVDDLDDRATRLVVDQAAADAPIDIRYVPFREGTGASSSRNRGAHLARGSLLAFLDDDDLWHPDFLSELADGALRSDAALMLGGLVPFKDGLVTHTVVAPPGLLVDDALAKNWGITGSNLLVRREAFDRIGGFDPSLRVSNDKDLFARLLDSGITYGVVARPLAYQRIHREARLTDNTADRAAALEDYRAKWRGRLSRRNDRRLRKSILRNRYRATRGPLGRLVILAHLLLTAPSGLRREFPRDWFAPPSDAPVQALAADHG